jgi:hypothetical protein
LLLELFSSSFLVPYLPYSGLVSAQGANAGVPASDWWLLHPLLYTHTKGRVMVAGGSEHLCMFCSVFFCFVLFNHS